MTDIDKRAKAIALERGLRPAMAAFDVSVKYIRLGIIEGMKLQQERNAVIVEEKSLSKYTVTHRTKSIRRAMRLLDMSPKQ